jgi:hypothetical protein
MLSQSCGSHEETRSVIPSYVRWRHQFYVKLNIALATKDMRKTLKTDGQEGLSVDARISMEIAH